MKTAAKIAIGVGVVAAVAGVVWYMRGKKAEASSKAFVDYVQTGQANEFFPGNQQPATALPVQIPGSPILTTAPVVKPVYTPTYTPQAERVYAPIDYSMATMIKRNFVEENLQGLKGLSYLLR